MDVLRLTPVRRTGALAPFSWVLAALDMAIAWLIVALLSIMVGVVTTQVMLRYGINSSIGWADEVSRLTFVWTMFLTIPLGVRAGSHIGIVAITERLPPALRETVVRAKALAAAAMLALLAWESMKLAADQWDEMMSSLTFSSSWFVVPVAICGVHGALHLLWIVLAGPSHGDPSLPQEPA